ncbi:MAG TPA: CoA transferase, partial [Acidimicrobiales bacterium]|nr:CoA transferase [Acidimicrobiales bacterium]
MEPPALLPLGDIRVVDLTIARAGPQCVRQLADWGADVVRIEHPADSTGVSGSDARNLHRNK